MSTRTSVISYARISSDTEQDAHGVIDQHKRNRENAARLGWEVVAEITDNDLSASRAEIYREGFEALVKALALGRLDDGTEVQGVIVVEQSRLARRHSDWERLSDALTVQEGRVYAEGASVHDPYSDAFDLHGAFGTFTNKSESKKIKARTTASHRRRAEQGIPVGGSRPFGWRADRRTLDPQEVPEARRIVAEYLQGRTLYGIAMDLRERGVLTTLGNPWTPDALRKYLANPRLCGWRMLRGEIVRGPAGEPVVGQWEPLVSPEDWQAVHARITNTKRTTPANTTRKYLLSGLLRCGKCGVLLRAMPTKRGDVAGKLLYTCPSKAMGGCGGVGRNAEVLERFVTQAALAHAEQVQAQHVPEGDWGREGEYAAAVDRRASLTSAWAAGRMPDEAYFMALEAVEKVLKDLRADREGWASRKATSEAMAGDIRREWENRADQLDWRRGFLADQLSAVVVLPVGGGRRPFNPDSVRLVWHQN